MSSAHGIAAAQPVHVAFWGGPVTYMLPGGLQQAEQAQARQMRELWQVQQTRQAHQAEQMHQVPMPHLRRPAQPLPAPLVVWMPVVARLQQKDAPMVPMVSEASTAPEAPDSSAVSRRASSASWASTCFSEETIGEQQSELAGRARRASSASWASTCFSEETIGEQQSELAGRVRTMSGDASGSRALQAALDAARSDEERAAIADELRGRVWEAIRCPNANHVVQKVIDVLPAQASEFILDEIAVGSDGRGRGVAQAARHRFGCRVLQRLVEQAWPESCTAWLDELVADSAELFVHPFGNYVIQHLLEHAPYEWRAKLLCMLEENIDLAATKPYARAVVSQALACAEDDHLASLARALCSRPSLLATMARTRHGHGGVVRLVRSLGGAEGDEVRRQLTEESDVFQSTRYGRAVALALKGM